MPLVAAVAMFGRFERPRADVARGITNPTAIGAGAGAALLAVAVLGVASSSIVDLAANAPVKLAVVTLTPIELLVAALAGVALVRRPRTQLNR